MVVFIYSTFGYESFAKGIKLYLFPIFQIKINPLSLNQ